MAKLCAARRVVRGLWPLAFTSIPLGAAALACSDDPDAPAQHRASGPDASAALADATGPSNPGPSPDSGAGADGGGDADSGVSLAGPSGLAASFGLEGKTIITWNPPSSAADVVGYTLHYGKIEGALDKTVTVSATERFASANTGTDGSTYYFLVRAAYSGERVSAPSETISARGSGLPRPTHPAQPGLRYQVSGGDMGRYYSFVSVVAVENDVYTDVTTAVVTVNGELLPATAPGRYYIGAMTTVVPVGGAMNLSVTIGTTVITATASAPEAPLLTSPAAAAVIAKTDDIPVAWTLAGSPEHLTVSVDCEGDGTRVYLPGTARDTRISARAFPPDRDCTVSVFAYADGTFTGNARLESEMNIREESLRTHFKIGP
jgi:hypothetical protein